MVGVADSRSDAASAWFPVSPAYPDDIELSQAPCDDGSTFMLPGFRFLFAAIMLSISTLVFGLGAAALLRASHEQFASLPVLPAAPALPPAATADASPHDTAPPTLALLRVDTPEIDAAAPRRAMPAPVSDHAAPAPEAKDAVAALPAPDLSAPEPKPAPAATTTSKPSAKTDKVETTATASLAPEPPQAAPEAAVIQPETPRPEPVADPADIATAEPAQAQPVTVQSAQTETVQQAERTQPEPVKMEATKAEPATPRIPDVALADEPRPAPLEPADAPIKTAMLAPSEPAPSTIADPAVAITGPIPLPRSREWALAQSRTAHRQPARKRTAAVRARARPRAVAQQSVRAQAQAPASAPNLLFPFGQ